MSIYRASRASLIALSVIVQVAHLAPGGQRVVAAAEYTATDLYTIGAPPVGDSLSLYSSGPGGVVAGAIGSAAVLFSPSNPSGEVFPGAQGILLRASGVQQVGGIGNDATLWNNAVDSPVDLNPSGWAYSLAYATNGAQQVGYAEPSGSSREHAVLWSGSAQSIVDLNPAGYSGSQAAGIGGGQQVGLGYSATGQKALLWNGTAASAINLAPVGSTFSEAYATNGAQQVGFAYTNGVGYQAILWSGSAASAVNLGQGWAYAIGAGKELGSGPTGQALVWSGTAASAFNLNTLLPSGYFVVPPQITDSLALGLNMYIDNQGNIFAFVQNSADKSFHVFEFTPTTPPLVGDVNYDGVVNAQDLALVASGWQQTGTNNANDANGDGIVNAQDLALISANWMAGTTTSNTAVPEPSALLLAAIAVLFVVAHHKRTIARHP